MLALMLTCVSICQEGAGHQVMSAFVEIVFDNSDNRIPVHPLIHTCCPSSINVIFLLISGIERS